MCIKIFRLEEEIEYDTNRPLEEQVAGSERIVINYEPKDLSIEKFFHEVEHMCKNGFSTDLNIVLNHNNSLTGARLRNKMDKFSKGLDVNRLVKLMVTSHEKIDKKLEEMSNYCTGESCDVKQKT